jgi:putative phosphonate metabolism protein
MENSMGETRERGLAGYRRYAIYVVPEGGFHDAGTAWLGWDALAGRAVAQPHLSGLPGPPEPLTATPRKYGFHGTVKPPFRLAEGMDAQGLHAALQAFCAESAAVTLPGLAVRRLGGFVAVVPEAPSAALADLAGATVAALDRFRAPPTEADLARRRKAGLTARQNDLLARWGYPYVMEEFRFHLTLTGRLPGAQADRARAALADYLDPVLPRPWSIDSLCLLGEAKDGRFHVLRRCPLTG